MAIANPKELDELFALIQMGKQLDKDQADALVQTFKAYSDTIANYLRGCEQVFLKVGEMVGFETAQMCPRCNPPKTKLDKDLQNV